MCFSCHMTFKEGATVHKVMLGLGEGELPKVMLGLGEGKLPKVMLGLGEGKLPKVMLGLGGRGSYLK